VLPTANLVTYIIPQLWHGISCRGEKEYEKATKNWLEEKEENLKEIKDVLLE